MTNPIQRSREKKVLSSVKHDTTASLKEDTRYDLKNAAPSVQEKASKLVGKSLNQARVGRTSLAPVLGVGQDIISNVRPDVAGSGSQASVSDITSAADQYNSYRFDEASALRTYKKMMTLHLKDEMFRKLKFITSDAMLEFSRGNKTICGYIRTKMRVPEGQWGEYWDLVRLTTKKMIEQQRTNATSAIKKGFRGKY
jgi:hypothetical protein